MSFEHTIINDEKLDVYLTHSKLTKKRTLNQMWRENNVESVIGKGLKNIQWMISVLSSDLEVKFSLTLNKNWELSINEHLFADLYEDQLKQNTIDVNDNKTEPRQSLLYRERNQSVDNSLNTSLLSESGDEEDKTKDKKGVISPEVYFEDKLKDYKDKKLNESYDSSYSDSTQKQQSDSTFINTTDVNFNDNFRNVNSQQNTDDITPSVSVIGDRKTFLQEVEDTKNTF